MIYGTREADLYRKLGEGRVQCQSCAHYCVLKPGEKGRCGVKQNISGKLYSLVYGKACAANIDPIEKKPFSHFLPGTSSYSIATSTMDDLVGKLTTQRFSVPLLLPRILDK